MELNSFTESKEILTKWYQECIKDYEAAAADAGVTKFSTYACCNLNGGVSNMLLVACKRECHMLC